MKYYSPFRPLTVGAFPIKQNMEIVNFDSPKFIPEIERTAWGYVETDRFENYKDYELVPEMKVYLVSYRLFPSKPPVIRMAETNIDFIPEDETKKRVCRRYFSSSNEALQFIAHLEQGEN